MDRQHNGFSRSVLLLASLFLLLVSCTTVLYKPEVGEVRRQYHVPEDVEIDSMMISYVNDIFGGGDISCYQLRFKFTRRQMDSYLAGLHNPEMWKETAFDEISPQTADACDADAFQWSELPAPAFKGWISYLNTRYDTTVQKGYWFCNVIYNVAVDTVRAADGKRILRWRTHRVRGNNIATGSEPVIITFGLLDLDKRTLFTRIEYRKPEEAGE